MTSSSITIHSLTPEIIPQLVGAFAAANWAKPAKIFETYLDEQIQHQRDIWVARCHDQIAGYITLKWNSAYPPFQAQNIPEIMDFNVLPTFRKQGIGTLLLTIAEQKAFATYDTVGLGVGLYADYGQALKMYVRHGYQPDGRGVTWQYQPVPPGSMVCLDDDLVLWFTKENPKSHLNQINLK